MLDCGLFDVIEKNIVDPETEIDADVIFTVRRDKDGKPVIEENDFMERIDGVMFLTANFDTIKEAVGSMQGVVLKEQPYKGNPSDLKSLQRCVPNASEILLRQC